MNFLKLDSKTVKSVQSTDKLASTSTSLRVRSDLKAGGMDYKKAY